MERKMKRKQAECEQHRYKELAHQNGKMVGYECVKCGFKTPDMQDDPNVIWTIFRCHNVQCNKILEKEGDRQDGFCRGCQGGKFVIATYLTDEEDAAIKAGTIKPHRVNLDVIGIEPEPPREVR